MSLRASTDAMPVGMSAAVAHEDGTRARDRGAPAGRASALWGVGADAVAAKHVSTARAIGGAMLAAAVLLLTGCSSGPLSRETESSSQPVGATAGADAGKSGSAATGGARGAAGANGVSGGAAGAGAGAGANGAAAVPITARGKADFDRAVGAMKAGNTTEAELEFKQVALQFPQLSAPYVNLGILYRKTGRLDQSEAALKTAVEHNDGSAVAWTELGATQRLRGEFPSAAASYEKAIAADPNFAPAYRNLGVVSDLYLGDPERALTAFERYKELTGEEKPVSGWIAELRQRTGKPPLKRPAPTPTAGATEGESSSGAGAAADGAVPAAAKPAPASTDPQPSPAAKPTVPADNAASPKGGE